MTKKTATKPFWEMTAKELAAATAEFESPATEPEGRPLNAAEVALHKAAAKRGRPRVGEGSQRINLTVERGLLEKVDAFAKHKGLKRAQLIALALRRTVAPWTAPKRRATKRKAS